MNKLSEMEFSTMYCGFLIKHVFKVEQFIFVKQRHLIENYGYHKHKLHFKDSILLTV